MASSFIARVPRVAELHARYVNGVSGFGAVDTARTARQATDLDARLRPVLVLLDQYLPDQLGSSLLPELLRRHHGDGCRGREPDPAGRLALGIGAVGYLIKPFDGPTLTARCGHHTAVTVVREARANAGQDDSPALRQGLNGPGRCSI